MAIGRALRATAAMTLGFAAVFAVFGLAIAPVAGSVQRYLPWFTVVLGLLIVVAGLWVALFLASAGGMRLVVGTAAVAVALARTGLLTRLRRSGAALARAAGVLMVVAGGYLAWYGAWELRVLETGAGRDPVVDAAAQLQQWLASTAETIGAGGFALGLLALVAAGLVLRGRARSRTPASRR